MAFGADPLFAILPFGACRTESRWIVFALAPTLRHQIAYAQAEFDALAHASRADSEESTILVHSHRHQIARTQAEHASVTIENESKNHLHLESDQTTFPTRGTPMPVRNGEGWRNPSGHARAQSASNQHDETRKE